MTLSSNNKILAPGPFLEQFPFEMVMALSWRQPYGTLMLYDKEETRRWRTKYRGWVLICTSKKPYDEYFIREISGPAQHARIHTMLQMEASNSVSKNMPNTAQFHGYAIAIGRIAECNEMGRHDEFRCYVEYYPGLFRHRYRNVHRIKPFPCKGQQGFKKLTQSDLEKIIVL